MDGHAETAGHTRIPVEIAGSTYFFATPRIGVMARMEALMANMLTNPMRLAMDAAEGQSDEIKTLLINKAAEQMHKTRVLTAQEKAEFSSTARGASLMLWAILQEHHAKQFTDPNDVMDLLDKVPAHELEALLAEIEAAGEGDAGNSSGPSRTARAKSKPKGQKRKNRKSSSRVGR